MQNLSDNELDNLFRKAAAHGGSPFDPAAWEALRKRLDDSQPPRPWIKWIIPGILSLMVFTGTVIVWNYTREASTPKQYDENAIRENMANAPEPTDGKNTRATSDETNQAPAETRPGLVTPLTEGSAVPEAATTKEGSTGMMEGPALPQHASTSLYNSTDKSSNRTIKPRDRTTHVHSTDEIVDDNATATHQKSAGTDTTKTNYIARHNHASPTSEIAKEAGHPVPRKQQPLKAREWGIASITSDRTAVSATEKTDSVHTPAVEPPGRQEKPVQNRYKLGIKLAVSPDYSSVRFTSPNGSGTNYGVLAEYHLTSRWSVVTGGIWSRKIYSATDVEYNGHPVSRADGDCRILDIPLNVNYVFNPDRKLSFYTSVGFSTYIMNKEDYVFHLDSGYGSAYSYSTNVRGKNNELFSIVNVSVGAQQKITRRWTLQLEPFVKVPVKGIGEGDLSLNTLGAFFHLKYSFYNMNNP